MSLLLDALKKAADDKLKKAEYKNQNNNQSIELDLDLKSDDPNGYSEVNNENITTHKPQTDDTKFDISEKLYSSKKIDIELDNNLTTQKEMRLEDIDDDTIKAEIDDAEADKLSNNNQTPLNVKPIKSQHSMKTPASRIETEQALSALIDKSNRHSRREKLKKNIIIGLIIALILIISGMYFYIEMQSTSQNFNLTGINHSPDNLFYQETISANKKFKTNTDSHSPLISNSLATKNIAPVKTPAKLRLIKPASVKKNHNKASPKQPTKTIKPIHITRTKKSDPIHLLVSDAYAAFHSVDYHRSEKLYKQALEREPKNRDALLGLAAIGIKENRYEYARQKYQYLLRLNPADSLAIAGLSGIEKYVDSQLSESQLKFMLKQQPDAAHLYFALGAQYSSQLKWAEAQSAYFSAWSADNKNADYCYNLAVSLDHLGKPEQALNFYKLSLKLKPASNGNFSQANTKQRIEILQASVK